ncbi:MAG: YggT family protein [Acidimicrobiia bacterium]|nr:YggT family protein [Acidimicrobiia bacterium]
MLADAVHSVLCPVLSIFLVVLFARAVLSWFPVEPGSFLQQMNDVLGLLTDWAVLPLRRIIPPVGMFDMSFLVLVIGLAILRNGICGP